uniref:AAA ATPase n=1 Tax=Sphingobacterium sp. (strain 21) TaxID=743722 RepID=F4C1J9_SPHS2
MDYFGNLLALLKLEQIEDRNSFQTSLTTLSITQRKKNGNTWFPVHIKKTTIERGDYISVEIERSNDQEAIHHFKSGASVALFSNLGSVNHRIVGQVSYLVENRMKVMLRLDELPDWIHDGKLGIDLLFDEYSYKQMQNALLEASKSSKNPLIQVLTGERQPVFFSSATPISLDRLNANQQLAIEKIRSANDIAIIHGPPGTGKTTTIIEACKVLLKERNCQLLVVAPSNTAVDLLTDQLLKAQINVTRIGSPSRVTPELLHATLDEQISQTSSIKEVKKIRKRANQFREMARRYKRNFGKEERIQRQTLFAEAAKLIKEADALEQYATESVIKNAQVITATLVGAGHYSIKNICFEAVIIDEAAQALEPACWIPILKAKKLILAGDHQQLPPTIKSVSAANQGLKETLLEKCIHLYPQSGVMLQEQYRMHTSIMSFSSQKFYQSSLIAHNSVANTLLFPNDQPLQFIDTVGCGFDERDDEGSIYNLEEASFVLHYLSMLSTSLSQHYSPENYPRIAIISPYASQVDKFKALLEADPLSIYKDKVTINTIDGFQGQERDIVIISLTRSNQERKIGFLSDIRRMNVAMTRAKKKLVMVGDSLTLSKLPFYADLITYSEKEHAYYSAWEYLNN